MYTADRVEEAVRVPGQSHRRSGNHARTADIIIKVLLAYLLIGSYGLLIWDWRRRKQARLEFATTNHTNYTNAG